MTARFTTLSAQCSAPMATRRSVWWPLHCAPWYGRGTFVAGGTWVVLGITGAKRSEQRSNGNSYLRLVLVIFPPIVPELSSNRKLSQQRYELPVIARRVYRCVILPRWKGERDLVTVCLPTQGPARNQLERLRCMQFGLVGNPLSPFFLCVSPGNLVIVSA